MAWKRNLSNIGSVRTGTHTRRTMTMNVNTMNADMRPSAVDRGDLHEEMALSIDDEMGEMDAPWRPEEFDEPEVWTLTNFADVLPYEVA